MIAAYSAELKKVLCQTLSLEYAEEILSEATGHLGERADELRAGGQSGSDAERQAVEEFGEVGEIAPELAKGYPPKAQIDTKRLRWLPEVAVVVQLAIAAYTYSVYGGLHGLESACQSLVPIAPMFIIPGMTAGLARLKYRRLRPLSIHTRMANYGFAFSLIGTSCLVGLQVTGQSTLTSIFPLFYAFGAAGILCYLLMRSAYVDGRVSNFLRQHLRIR